MKGNVSKTKDKIGLITTDRLADGVVTEAKLADGTITEAKLSEDVTEKINNRGVHDHNELTNRDLADQHPIYAITGLNTKLNDLSEKIADAESKCETSNDNLTNRIDTNATGISSINNDIGDINVDISSIRSDISDINSAIDSLHGSDNSLKDYVDEQITAKANIKKNPDAPDGDIIDTHLTVGVRSGDVGKYSFVSGGYNDVLDDGAVRVMPNVASGYTSAVVGGGGNVAGGNNSVVSGGSENRTSGTNSAIVGGFASSTGGEYSAIVGGFASSTGGEYSAIVGGFASRTGGEYSAIVGGFVNEANGIYSAIVGGNKNRTSGYGSVVIGGYSNKADEYGTVINGAYHTALTGQFKCGHYSNDGTAGAIEGTTGDAFIIGNGALLAQSNCFRVAYDGNVYGMAAFNSTGADYAEYFEWADGNTDNEDRRGLFVALAEQTIYTATIDGVDTELKECKKIKIANSDDEIIGVISAIPSIIGNAYDDQWQGMYLTDVFGQPLSHMVHHDAEYIEIEVHDKDEEGNILETTHTEQVVVHEAYDAEEYIINPRYNPEQEYIPRSQRKEWAIVGMFGQIIVTDDGSCTPCGYCTVKDNGIATSAERGWRVLNRVDENHVKILFK